MSGIVERLIELELEQPISKKVDISTPNRYMFVVGYSLRVNQTKTEYKTAYSIYA